MPTSSIPASGGGGLIPKYSKFTSSGTFTLPDGYGAAKPLVISIQVIGGGGAGSGSLGALNVTANNVMMRRVDYFGNDNGVFPVNIGTSAIGNYNFDMSNNLNGWGGGSGGIAQTQMALTGPLTITVGAAGTRAATPNTYVVNAWHVDEWGRGGSNTTGARNYNIVPRTASGSAAVSAGGSGGTSTAGAVSATGGNGGNAGNFNIRGQVTFPTDQSINATNSIGPYTTIPTFLNHDSSNHGTAGQPAGTAGGATPLLGALAGGSGSTTPVYGAFGVGGKKGDAGTHTGVEGTGGGYGSIAASGAVIISYWA
jgi:hypothetical protein